MGRGAPGGYELHVGTFFAVDQAGHDRRGTRGGQYLDVATYQFS
jgi:hypothetical protein